MINQNTVAKTSKIGETDHRVSDGTGQRQMRGGMGRVSKYTAPQVQELADQLHAREVKSL